MKNQKNFVYCFLTNNWFLLDISLLDNGRLVGRNVVINYISNIFQYVFFIICALKPKFNAAFNENSMLLIRFFFVIYEQLFSIWTFLIEFEPIFCRMKNINGHNLLSIRLKSLEIYLFEPQTFNFKKKMN